jgi:hypothetical protein
MDTATRTLDAVLRVGLTSEQAAAVLRDVPERLEEPRLRAQVLAFVVKTPWAFRDTPFPFESKDEVLRVVTAPEARGFGSQPVLRHVPEPWRSDADVQSAAVRHAPAALCDVPAAAQTEELCLSAIAATGASAIMNCVHATRQTPAVVAAGVAKCGIRCLEWVRVPLSTAQLLDFVRRDVAMWGHLHVLPSAGEAEAATDDDAAAAWLVRRREYYETSGDAGELAVPRRFASHSWGVSVPRAVYARLALAAIAAHDLLAPVSPSPGYGYTYPTEFDTSLYVCLKYDPALAAFAAVHGALAAFEAHTHAALEQLCRHADHLRVSVRDERRMLRARKLATLAWISERAMAEAPLVPQGAKRPCLGRCVPPSVLRHIGAMAAW